MDKSRAFLFYLYLMVKTPKPNEEERNGSQPTRKVTYFEPVPPRLVYSTIGRAREQHRRANVFAVLGGNQTGSWTTMAGGVAIDFMTCGSRSLHASQSRTHHRLMSKWRAASAWPPPSRTNATTFLRKSTLQVSPSANHRQIDKSLRKLFGATIVVRSHIVIQLWRRLQNWQPVSLVACNLR